MNKVLCSAIILTTMLTGCQNEKVDRVKGSELVNKSIQIVSSPQISESILKQMKFSEPVKAEVKKEFKPIVKKDIHKIVKVDKSVTQKSNVTIKKENNKSKINNKPVAKQAGKKYVKEMVVEATAYTISEGGKSRNHPEYGLTANGSKAIPNVTVAMSKSIPFNTIIRMPNGSLRRVSDRGGAIKNGRMDVLVSSRSEARKFGRKKIKITIVRWGDNKKYF